MRDKIFLIIFGVLFVALTLLFTVWPRSTFSELERRELAKFPEYTPEKLTSGKYAEEISQWFSDTEPYRDNFMTAHMRFKDLQAWHPGGEDEQVTFHASDGPQDVKEEKHVPTAEELEAAERSIGEFENADDDGVAKVANAGIIVTGKRPEVRAMMVYGGGSPKESPYAKMVNSYVEELPSNVKVYAMVIPTAIAYYCPASVKGRTKSQAASISNMYAQLDKKAHAVDVFTPLGQHSSENIFLRTDHHWAPLGAFYAAQKFAQVAKVPFRSLDKYKKDVIHGYVGTMYGYSKDISVKDSPEDFIYYTPKDTTYTTTVVDYNLDSNYKISKESAPYKGKFFYQFKDGSKSAYLTFMGGDQKFVHVKTGVKNGRRLVIIKDSFGNALPGYLFGSFEDIYVVDFRYYPHDLKQHIKDAGVTDVLIALNVFNAYNNGALKKITKLISSSTK